MQISWKVCIVWDSMGDRIRATMTRWTPPQPDPHPPSSPLSKFGRLITSDVKRRRRKRGLASINTHYYIHLSTHLDWGDHEVAHSIYSDLVHLSHKDRNGTLDRGLDTKHDVFVILRTIELSLVRPYFILIQISFFRKNQRYRNSSLLFPYFLK
jgi:hypothetical protein